MINVVIFTFFFSYILTYELNEIQNLKFSSCVNLTKARMQNKKDNEFANVVNSMMLSTNVTKDETTKQLLSLCILLCYRDINETHARKLANTTVEEIDPLEENNKKLLRLKQLNKIYKEKNIDKINEVFEEVRKAKEELAIYDPENDEIISVENKSEEGKKVGFLNKETFKFIAKLVGFCFAGFLLIGLVMNILRLSLNFPNGRRRRKENLAKREKKKEKEQEKEREKQLFKEKEKKKRR